MAGATARRALRAAAAAAAVVTAALVVVRHRIVVVRVRGASMEPTLRDGQRVVVRRTGLDGVVAGQLVVFTSLARAPGAAATAADPAWMVKRAVALPGDPVPLDLLPPSAAAVGTRVPPGCLVVLGDNRSASFDSRRAGYVDGTTLLGVVRRTIGSAAPDAAEEVEEEEGFVSASTNRAVRTCR